MNYHDAIRQQRIPVFSVFAHALLNVFLASVTFAATLPALPQAYIDTIYSAPTGATCSAANSSDFQTCLNNATLNSTIVLQAGTTYQGPFTLPNKTSGSGWIYILSSAYDRLPPPETRVSPTDASNMPKITATSGGVSAIVTASNAHHYRFIGIEFTPVAGNFLYNLIRIGNNDTSPATLPEHITFDRCYIHGDPSKGGRRGIAMDGKSVAVIDSYVSGFKEIGADTQALWAYNTPGPIKIVNNYLEGAGENVMFGGADPRITNCVPSDIEIKSNHFFKPLSWKTTGGMVKNLFELKNARRVLIERNVFENNWADSQNGTAILFTPRNQDGTAPWSTVEDVTFMYNKLINSARGFNILGRDDLQTSQITSRILIQNNVVEGLSGYCFVLLNGIVDLTIDHNTLVKLGSLAISDGSPKNSGFAFTNNIVPKGTYGFFGSNMGEGNLCLQAYYDNYEFIKNAIIGGNVNIYPANNYFPANPATVKFVNYDGGNYRLASDSAYNNLGTDGKDLGADIDAIEAPIAGTPRAPIGLRMVP